MPSLGELKLIKSRTVRTRYIQQMSTQVRQNLAELADVGRKKRIEEASEFTQLAYDLRGEHALRDVNMEAEEAWKQHSIGFSWTTEEQRYGEYRAFVAGFENGKLFRESPSV